MADREIVAAALRWHAARARRLAIGAEKRQAATLDGIAGLRLQTEISAQYADARRMESAALRALSKACQAQRGVLDESDVIEMGGGYSSVSKASG